MAQFVTMYMRRSAREAARLVSDATGEAWITRGFTDRQLRVEGTFDGRPVTLTVWAYFLGGSPEAKVLVPVERNPGSIRIQGSKRSPSSDKYPPTGDPAIDTEITVETTVPGLEAHVLTSDLIATLQARNYTIIELVPAGSRGKEWTRDNRPNSLLGKPHVMFYGIPLFHGAEELVEAIRCSVGVARRVETFSH